jgi:hypothetical protein
MGSEDEGDHAEVVPRVSLRSQYKLVISVKNIT